MRSKWAWFLVLLIFVVAVILLLRERRLSAAEELSLETLFSTPAGTYDRDIRLRLDVAHPEAEIFFTLDGRFPEQTSGTPYTQPIILDADSPQIVVVRARAFLPDGTSGPVVSATYFMGIDHNMPMLSIIADPDDFWGAERGIYVNHAQRGPEWERPVDLTYIAADGKIGFEVGAGVRIHGGWTRYFSDKKSLRLYFRDAYGARKLTYPLFGNEGQIAFDHLVLHSSSQDLLLFRNQLVDQLAAQMGGYVTRSQPLLLFINGRPWGIYNMRERINERWLAENYGTPAADISDTPNNRGMQSDEQLAVDTVHWENLMAFVLENDLTDPANYVYLQTQMDIENFVDYYILQMYAANTDWPHHNVQQFRPRTQGGRWEWTVWDNDFAFERVDRQMVDHVLNVEHPLGERMVILLNKLLANPEFRNLFITRTADLLNTTLDTPNVLANIEQITDGIEPDIAFEQQRWDISAEWDDVVAHMRDFAERRPDIMREQMVDSLDLAGRATISFTQADGEPGWISVNGGEPQPLPWQGVFFKDSVIRMQAIPESGYAFTTWEGLGQDEASANPTSIEVVTDLQVTPRFVPLDEMAPRPGDAAIVGYHANDTGVVEGDWFDIQTRKDGGLDLRGWRLTDNDTMAADDEGSLIFGDDPLLAEIPKGSIVRVIATKSRQNAQQFPEDGWQDGVLLFYVGNGVIDTGRDPWFNLGPRDNLLLLAPGLSGELDDDIPIDLWSENSAVTRSFFALPPAN